MQPKYILSISPKLIYSNLFCFTVKFIMKHSIEKKRTKDSFILNTETKNFAEIISILVAENKLYFLVDERFEIEQPQNRCDFVVYLKDKELPCHKIIESKFIGSKFALIQFENILI